MSQPPAETGETPREDEPLTSLTLHETAEQMSDRGVPTNWVDAVDFASLKIEQQAAEIASLREQVKTRDEQLVAYGRECETWITGEAAELTTPQQAWLAIKKCIRLGQERNNEANKLRVDAKVLREVLQAALHDHEKYPQLRLPEFQAERFRRVLTSQKS